MEVYSVKRKIVKGKGIEQECPYLFLASSLNTYKIGYLEREDGLCF